MVMTDLKELRRLAEGAKSPYLKCTLDCMSNQDSDAIHKIILSYPELIERVERSEKAVEVMNKFLDHDQEFFEDGLSSDLHEMGIKSKEGAYVQGFIDAKNELKSLRILNPQSEGE